MLAINRVFSVQGRPFFVVGAQARNSSAYNAAEWSTAFRALQAIHGNTLEVPIYWEQVEPVEGQFDWASVDGLIACARRDGVHLILLWFGTWKNGAMDYVPAWVKADPVRFRRVLAPTGKDIWNLSAHCPANLDADLRAFSALCRHLQETDARERTVIALQVENEPGILGCDRDYGSDGQAAYAAQVPAGLLAGMRAAGAGRVYDLWQQAGARPGGTWPEVFGWAAGELLTAWAIATYIDRLAEAGKAIHDVPMYVNAWLGDWGWNSAGETYPAGGAVGRTLDIYRWCAPHIDLIAPDIYIADSRNYEATCATYARADNPLFVPESAPGGANAWNLFRAVAGYGAIGYSFFGAEQILADDGAVRPEARAVVASIRCLAAAAPLLLRYQGTGHIHAVIQEENLGAYSIDLDGYTGLIEFESTSPAAMRDWRYAVQPPAMGDERRGRGLVIQAGRHEFYLVGCGFRLTLRPKLPPEMSRDMALSDPFLLVRQVHYVRVDEGHFDAQGEYVVDRRRNGDEVNFGVWTEADTGVVRAVLCD